MAKKKAPFLFYVIMVLIPVLFFALLEIGLRLGGYGRDYQLFTEVKGAPPGMIYLNPELSYKYFGNLENPVFSPEIGMRKEKPADGFRVFVFGGSSAQGFPYARTASFPSHLERKLQYSYPDKTIEVVNLGTSAINSHTLRDILPQVLERSPDLILFYAGHNEYYGALGPASSRLGNPGFVRLLLRLKQFRFVQLIENLLGSSNVSEDENKNLMQDMIGQSSIALNGDVFNQGVEQFDANLEAFISEVQKSDVPMIIGTLSSNLSGHEPFNSELEDDLGITAQNYFNLGQQALDAGDFTKAKEYFRSAKEADGLRFRAPQKMNEIIRKKSLDYKIPLVDIEFIFHSASRGGITGDSLMCDHLHPSREGYFLMAKSYFKKMVETNNLPGSQQAAWPSDSLMLSLFPYSSLDSMLDRRLLLTGLGQYPFVPLGSPNPYQDAINNDGFGHAIKSRSEIDSIRSIVAVDHFKRDNTEAFLREMDVFISQFPLKESGYLRTTNRLLGERLLEQAYPLIYPKLAALKESRTKHKMLGLCFKQMRQYDSSEYHLARAFEINQGEDELSLELGFVYLVQEKYQEAVRTFTIAIETTRESKEAYHQRGVAYFELKNFEKTAEDMTEVIRLGNESEALPFLIRGYASFGLRDTEASCADWRSAGKLGSQEALGLLQRNCR